MSTIAQLELADVEVRCEAASTTRERLEQLFRELRTDLITVKMCNFQLDGIERRFDPKREELLNRLGNAQLRAAVVSEEIDDAILEAAEEIRAARAETPREPVNAELVAALDKAERMITYVASVFYLKDLQDSFPGGMADEVKAYIRDSSSSALLRKAKAAAQEVQTI
jgi:transcriptional regulator NrdR family protein